MRQQSDTKATVLTPIHPLLLRGFRIVARRRLRGSFRALRIAHLDRFPKAPNTPLIVYLNHPSWWDPLTSIVLAPHLIGNRNFYAPIEAEALKRYAIFRRLGLFPVETDTPRGAAQFLRSAEAVLAGGDVLAITPQGRFTDVRTRPLALKSGLGVLLARMERRGNPVTVVPLALEYTFWNERTPEVLASVGEALTVNDDSSAQGSPSAWAELLEQRLAATQDDLARLALTREPEKFVTLMRGRGDVAGFYGLWQKLTGRSRAAGQ